MICKRALFVSAIVLLLAGAASPRSASLSAGLGGGSFGLGYGISASYHRDHLIWSVRYVRQDETQLLGDIKPHESVADLAILVGVRRKLSAHWSATFEVGGGPVWLVRRGAYLSHDGIFESTYEKLTPKIAGLAMQSQIYYGHIGLLFFGNYNARESYGGVLLCVKVG